jgi:dUTP pyrophosphatase
MANLNESLLTFKFQKLNKNAQEPYKELGNIGWDLRCIEDEFFQVIFNGEFGKRSAELCYDIPAKNRHVFHTGIAIELPEGYHAILKPRSGLAVKHGVDVLAGVIDNSYRGEIMVCLYNTGGGTVRILPGDKICQMVIVKENEGEFTGVEKLSDTKRGEKGFGSSGR